MITEEAVKKVILGWRKDAQFAAPDIAAKAAPKFADPDFQEAKQLASSLAHKMEKTSRPDGAKLLPRPDGKNWVWRKA